MFGLNALKSVTDLLDKLESLTLIDSNSPIPSVQYILCIVSISTIDSNSISPALVLNNPAPLHKLPGPVVVCP